MSSKPLLSLFSSSFYFILIHLDSRGAEKESQPSTSCHYLTPILSRWEEGEVKEGKFHRALRKGTS